MRCERRVFIPLIVVLFLIFLVGCSGAMDIPSAATEDDSGLPLEEPPPTQGPTPLPTEYPGTEGPMVPTPTPFIEERKIEIEWPPDMRLGDSDIVRLSLIPTENGYNPQVEFEEHNLEVKSTEIPYRAGFEAFAIARMDAVGLQFSPKGDQEQRIIEAQILNWRWSISPQNAGTHRLACSYEFDGCLSVMGELRK